MRFSGRKQHSDFACMERFMFRFCELRLQFFIDLISAKNLNAFHNY